MIWVYSKNKQFKKMIIHKNEKKKKIYIRKFESKLKSRFELN